MTSYVNRSPVVKVASCIDTIKYFFFYIKNQMKFDLATSTASAQILITCSIIFSLQKLFQIDLASFRCHYLRAIMDIAFLAYTSDSDGRPVSFLEPRKKKDVDIEEERAGSVELRKELPVNAEALEFRQLISPLVKALLYFAVDVRPSVSVAPSAKARRGCLISKILPIIHLAMYLITCALFYFSAFHNGKSSAAFGLKQFSANLAKGLCITAFFVTHLFFFFRRRKISTLLDDIAASLAPQTAGKYAEDEARLAPLPSLVGLRWMAIAVVPLPFLLLVLAYGFYKVAGVVQDAVFALTPLNITSQDIDGNLADGLTMVFFFFFAVNFCFFVYAVGLFCLIIRTLGLIVERLRCPGVASSNLSAAVLDVATFLRLHEVVCRLVVETDGSFKEVACVWCTVEMTCAVLFGRSANVNFKDTPEFDFVLAFLIIILLFVYKVLTTATVNNSVVSSLKEISYVDENTLQDLSPRSAALATKIKLYIQHVMVSSPTITGWGLFTIDKAVVLSAAGSILTYILVLYDK